MNRKESPPSSAAPGSRSDKTVRLTQRNKLVQLPGTGTLLLPIENADLNCFTIESAMKMVAVLHAVWYNHKGR